MGLSSDLTSASLELASSVAVSCLTALTSAMTGSCFSRGFITGLPWATQL